MDIEGICTRMGTTQSILAKRTGLSPDYLSRMMTGKLNPTISKVYKVCEALNVGFDELLDLRLGNRDRIITSEENLLELRDKIETALKEYKAKPGNPNF